jgi:hypothetical protein
LLQQGNTKKGLATVLFCFRNSQSSSSAGYAFDSLVLSGVWLFQATNPDLIFFETVSNLGGVKCTSPEGDYPV